MQFVIYAPCQALQTRPVDDKSSRVE